MFSKVVLLSVIAICTALQKNDHERDVLKDKVEKKPVTDSPFRFTREPSTDRPPTGRPFFPNRTIPVTDERRTREPVSTREPIRDRPVNGRPFFPNRIPVSDEKRTREPFPRREPIRSRPVTGRRFTPTRKHVTDERKTRKPRFPREPIKKN